MSNSHIIVRRSLAIGDALAASVVADKLIEQGLSVHYQTHPVSHSMMRLHPKLSGVSKPNGFCHVNLDGAYEYHPERTVRHMSEFFMFAANQQLAGMGINLGDAVNCRPRLVVPDSQRESVKASLAQHPKPWIFICPRSHTYNVRQIPADIWSTAASEFKGTAFWLGLDEPPSNIVDLHTRRIEEVISWLSVADLLVTVDTGPMHIAAALSVPIVAICQSSSPELHLSNQCDFLTIKPPALDCLNCQLIKCPVNESEPPCRIIDPHQIASWVNRQLKSTQAEEISAVIPIFRPSAEMLNRCIEAVLPQVSEVVTTRERMGILPQGVKQDPKIRHVVKNEDGIGFGKNVNFGVRQSHGKYVLVLNDDVYLAPNAVVKLMQVMKPKVGVIGHLTRYPNGTIYHAGKPRDPNGGIGFPHIDLGKKEHTIRHALEMENTNGASLLFRRKAFFEADGYDEAFKFYAEDDDICMKLRLAGWQVWYTPHATGVHDSHQETKHLQGINQIMQQSNQRFADKWREYFKHNKGNQGLGNFNYLKK